MPWKATAIVVAHQISTGGKLDCKMKVLLKLSGCGISSRVGNAGNACRITFTAAYRVARRTRSWRKCEI